MNQYCQNCGTRLNGEAYCPKCQRPTGERRRQEPSPKPDSPEKANTGGTAVQNWNPKGDVAMAVALAVATVASMCFTGMYLGPRSHRGANLLLPFVPLVLPAVVTLLTKAAVSEDSMRNGTSDKKRLAGVLAIASLVIWDIILLILAISNPAHLS